MMNFFLKMTESNGKGPDLGDQCAGSSSIRYQIGVRVGVLMVV